MAVWFIRKDPVALLEQQLEHLKQQNEHLRQHNDALLELLKRRPEVQRVEVQAPVVQATPDAAVSTVEFDEPVYVPTIKAEKVSIKTATRKDAFDEASVDKLRNKV